VSVHSTTSMPGKRLGIVARVSTDEQEETGYSLADQVDKGRHLAALHGYVVDESCIYSGEESGALPLGERPIIQRVLADARAGRFDVVCFTKIDRMARKLKYMLELWDAFDKAGVAVHVIAESIDTSTPTGRFMRNVLGSIAELERDTILERTMAGRKKKLRNGELYLCKPMYGYTYIKQDKARKIPGRVVINQEQVPYVRRMFEQRARGYSWQRIALELTAERVPTLHGNPTWSHASVRSVVMNPAYKGEGLFGRRRSAPTEKSRRARRWVTDPDQLIKLAYPPIVTPELWDAANAVTGRQFPRRTTLDRYLLRGGLVFCGEHDRYMHGSTNQRGVRTYQCCRTLPNGRMTTHRCPGPALDEAVWASVMAFLADPERGLANAIRLADEAAARVEELEAKRAALQRTYAALDDEAAALLRLARRGTIPERRIDASMREVEEQQAAIRDELATLEAQQTLTREDLPRADRVIEVCQHMARGALYATPEEKRELLDMLGVRVTMRGLDYTITGSVPDMAMAGTLERTNGDVLLQMSSVLSVSGWRSLM